MKHCTLCDDTRQVEFRDPESNHHRVPPEPVPCPACTIKCLHCGAEGWQLPEGTQQLTEWGCWSDPLRKVWCDSSCLQDWIAQRGGATAANMTIVLVARDIVLFTPDDWEMVYWHTALDTLDTTMKRLRAPLLKELER